MSSPISKNGYTAISLLEIFCWERGRWLAAVWLAEERLNQRLIQEEVIQAKGLPV